MREERFEVPVAGGVLAGHRGGDGPPALLLHGGPAVADYTEGCAAELSGVFETIRYTQRGVPPSVVAPPYSIESHLADALAVLDFFGLDRAWAIGHSWGGHLALHLAVAHPERLLGIVCIDPLGAYGEIFEEFGVNLRRALSPAAGRAHRGDRGASPRGRLDRGRPARAVGHRLALVLRPPGSCAAESPGAGGRPVLGRHERLDHGALRT